MTRGPTFTSHPQVNNGTEPPTVLIVEDDALLREALSSLFRSVGMRAQLRFRSRVAERPASRRSKLPCARYPAAGGEPELEFQTQLGNAGIHLPIIFMTAHGDIAMSVKAMKAGAMDFLAKPFRDQDMLDAVATALGKDEERREADRSVADLRRRYESLTPREREVMAFVASGLMNKQIAAEMNLSEITVKIHRGQAMKKMGARTLADLVRMAAALGIAAPKK